MTRRKLKRKIASTAPKGSVLANYGGKWIPAFIKALAETGNVSASAKMAGVDRRTAQTWHKTDPDFAEQWADALEQAADGIKAEIRRRAVEGVDDPVIYEGQPAFVAIDKDGKLVPMPRTKKQTALAVKLGVRIVPFTVKRYSDGLLQFLAKSARPHEFGDRVSMNHSGKVETVEEVVLTHTAPPAGAVVIPGVAGEE